MVHFRSTATLLATTLSIAHLVLGGPATGSGTGPTFTVLTGTSEDACSPDKIDKLQTRITEAIILAKAATTALNVKGIETSPAFKDYLGTADPRKIEAQRYAPIAGIASPVSIKSVTSLKGHEPDVKATAPPTETLFLCAPPASEVCTENGQATGVLAVSFGPENAVMFCPIFFGGVSFHDPNLKKSVVVSAFSLAEGKAAYLAGHQAHETGAFAILHEMQHLPSVVGEMGVIDDVYIKTGAPNTVVPKPADVLETPQGVVAAYTREQCKGLPKDKKSMNPQDLAYFALDVYADPARAKPQSGLSKVASKVAAKVGGSKKPKRFEAIHRRRADKEAMADQGA